MNTVNPYNILAISGSLREKSLNSALLSSVISMIPSRGTVVNYSEMAQLPHFNPDLDLDDIDAAVANWRRNLKKANGVLICTPEYAKGVPGSLKNALDWVVSSGEFVNKPVAVISASPHWYVNAKLDRFFKVFKFIIYWTHITKCPMNSYVIKPVDIVL
jgi:chromate reductase, NAD(P)H dehydrogenase (quinone)